MGAWLELRSIAYFDARSAVTFPSGFRLFLIAKLSHRTSAARIAG